MKLYTALFACATLCLAAPKVEPKTEIGEINGAKFRIDIPDNWNGGLVMYCHGYSPVAGAYKEGKLPPVLAVNNTEEKFGITTPPASFKVTARLPNVIPMVADCVWLPLITIVAGTCTTVTVLKAVAPFVALV